MLRELKDRGIEDPALVIADGHLGIWAALPEIFPEAREQRCWNHKVVNVLDQVSTKKQAEAKMMITPFRTQKRARKRRKAGGASRPGAKRMDSRKPRRFWLVIGSG